MAEGERKKIYEIKEEVLNILLSVDDESAEGREIREARNSYFNTLHNINHYAADLKSILNKLEMEEKRAGSLHRQLAVNEKETSALKDEILLLNKERTAIKNPERILAEHERQASLIAELSEKKTALEKDIFQTEKQLSEDLKTAAAAAGELKKIIPEIKQKRPQKTALAEEVRNIEKSAKPFVERGRRKSVLKEHEDEFNARSGALNKLEETISECNESIPDLKAAIKKLRDRIGPLEESAKDAAKLLKKRTALQSDMEGIEREHAAIDLRVEEARGKLESKNGVLKALEQDNREMKESIASIEEAVKPFSETAMEIKSAKGKLEESTALNEQTITEIERQLSEKILMDNELSILEDTMRTIVESIKAKT
jgi:chromosome segregation ATPase